MFVVIYRWRIQPGREQDFIAQWRSITDRGHAAGSGGSSLFKDGSGVWVAIARWSSREARDDFFAQGNDADTTSGMAERARLAVIERLPTEELDGVVDSWAPFPGPAGTVGS